MDELEDNLLDYMEEEFGIILEDNSERQLADWICKMYEGCAKGDVTLAREVVAMAMKAEKEGQLQGVKSVIQSADGDMDESDEEDDEGEDPNDSMEGGEGTAATESNNITTTTTMQESELAMAYVSGNLFGGPPKPIKELPPPRQLGESEPEKPQPVVDDDGFAPVVSKRKGKKI